MARRPRIPPQLTLRPFTLSEARAAGISRRTLEGKTWKRLGRGLYCWAGLPLEPWALLAAWRTQFPPDTVFSGLTAAWLHRLDVDPLHPIEVMVSSSAPRSRRDVLVRYCKLRRGDVCRVRGLRATTAVRTFADLRRRLPAVEYLVLADAAVRLGLGRFDDDAEPAESPMETRLRWLLINAGLPRPEVQASLSFGRADLFYRAARLVIEYDGDNHRDRLRDDNRRQNELLRAGYTLLRYTASDVYQTPERTVMQVRQALQASGTARPAAAESA